MASQYKQAQGGPAVWFFLLYAMINWFRHDWKTIQMFCEPEITDLRSLPVVKCFKTLK